MILHNVSGCMAFSLNIDGKERLFLDVYHPANRWSDLMNYYTVVNIYQQALKERIEG